MTASALLTRLLRRGATLCVYSDRVSIRDPEGTLAPDLREAVVAHKSELLKLLRLADEYRSLLRHALDAADTPPASAEVQLQGFLWQQARLVDELGPALALAIRDAVGRAWREVTGVCPWCEGTCRCDQRESSAGTALAPAEAGLFRPSPEGAAVAMRLCRCEFDDLWVVLTRRADPALPLTP